MTDAESTDDAVERVRQYFDDAVEAEWARLDETVAGRVSFAVHRHFLARFVTPGMRVLEVGAGPGRFTRELAALGAEVEVTDLSEAQLSANRERARQEGWASSVTGWQRLDVRDTSPFDDAAFDVVVAFGGPLSYVFDHAEQALAGLLRVTTASGHVVASVMSLAGAYRAFLPAVLELPDDENDHILATGDLRRSQPDGHVCRMFRAREVRDLVAAAGGAVTAMSASHWTALEHGDVLTPLEQEPQRWAAYLEREVSLAAEPGALDGGTHIMFAARNRR